MTGTPTRFAVQVGTRTLRVAGAAAGAESWLVAELSVQPPRTGSVLSELLGPTPDELVVVHPPSWSAAEMAERVRELGGLAGRVSTIAAPRAAAVHLPCVVVDVGHLGTELTRLAADGAVLTCHHVPVGGAQLDAVLHGLLRQRSRGPDQAPPLRHADEVPAGEVPAGEAAASGGAVGGGAVARSPEVRRAREQLSLLPRVDVAMSGPAPPVTLHRDELTAALAEPLSAVVDQLCALRGDGPGLPVLLIGGVARTPLLAELMDAAGITPVTVAPRPDAVAVLGALRPPPGPDPLAPDPLAPDPLAPDPPPPDPPPPDPPPPDPPATGPPGRDPPPVGEVRAGGRATTEGAAVEPGATAAPVRSAAAGDGLQPPFPPPRRRPLRTALATLAAVLVAAALVGLGQLLFPPTAAVATPAGVLVQYGYRFDVPAGWEHSGGLPERRRVLLSPAATPEGSELIAVERTPLGYDSAAERPRALAELRAEFDAAVARGSPLSGYRFETQAGRELVRYEQADTDGRPAVEWVVLLDGDAQFSVGCRHNPTGAAAVRAACALVVGSLRLG